jgi:hypothetical protein
MPDELQGQTNRENLVTVFETNDDSEALVVRSLLESGGMDVLFQTTEAPAGVFPFSSMPLGHIRLEVVESQAEEALRVITEYRRRGPEDAERAEQAAEGAGGNDAA